MDEELYTSVVVDDWSFGQAVIAGAQASSPVYTADQFNYNDTPPTPPIGVPVAGSAAGFAGSFLNGLFGGGNVPRTYSPTPGVTLNPQALARRVATGDLKLWPPQVSVSSTQTETIVIVALVVIAIYAAVKL